MEEHQSALEVMYELKNKVPLGQRLRLVRGLLGLISECLAESQMLHDIQVAVYEPVVEDVNGTDEDRR